MKLKPFYCHSDGKAVKITETEERKNSCSVILAPNATIARQIYDTNLKIRRLQTS